MEKLFEFLKRGTCAATVVQYMGERLDQAGFQELACDAPWTLEAGVLCEGAGYILCCFPCIRQGEQAVFSYRERAYGSALPQAEAQSGDSGR